MVGMLVGGQVPRKATSRVLLEHGPLDTVHLWEMGAARLSPAPSSQSVETVQQVRGEERRRVLHGLVQYLRLSSVHGLNHISTASSRHPAERLLWAVLVALAVYGAVATSMATWHHYSVAPTVTSLERDYMAWNTTFPPVTLCPGKAHDPDRVEATAHLLAREFPAYNETHLRVFLEELAAATLYTLSDIPRMLDIKTDRFIDLIEQVSPSWNISVVSSLATDPETDTYNHQLVPTMTEIGLCYSFNSVVAPYVSPRYWREGEAALDSHTGLLEVHPVDGSVFAQLSALPSGYQVFVHGPGEVPDLLTPFLTSPDGQFKRFEVSALAVHTTDAARGLRPHQRRCRFTDEPEKGLKDGLSPNIPVYSYSLCRRGCRARLAQRLCQCVPYFYGVIYDKGVRVPTCDYSGLSCINGFFGSLYSMTDPYTAKAFPCRCLPNCNDVTYRVESDANSPWFLGTDMKWSLIRYPRMRLKRDTLFGLTDLLVQVGSTAGLFLGCSVLSVIELVYFFTLRLYWNARRNDGLYSATLSLR